MFASCFLVGRGHTSLPCRLAFSIPLPFGVPRHLLHLFRSLSAMMQCKPSQRKSSSLVELSFQESLLGLAVLAPLPRLCACSPVFCINGSRRTGKRTCLVRFLGSGRFLTCSIPKRALQLNNGANKLFEVVVSCCVCVFPATLSTRMAEPWFGRNGKKRGSPGLKSKNEDRSAQGAHWHQFRGSALRHLWI